MFTKMIRKMCSIRMFRSRNNEHNDKLLNEMYKRQTSPRKQEENARHIDDLPVVNVDESSYGSRVFDDDTL
jgi:hypothetical protein